MRAFTYISILRNANPMGLAITILVMSFIYIPTATAETTADPMVIYKSPSCGCCGAWVEHMTAAGFSTTIKHPKNLNAIKQTLGVAPVYQACHTATFQGYVFEGHIPAAVIQHFLANKPTDVAGLAVAGMPMGSPGMDTNRPYRAYQVVQLNQDGSSTPYASVSASNTTYLEKK